VYLQNLFQFQKIIWNWLSAWCSFQTRTTIDKLYIDGSYHPFSTLHICQIFTILVFTLPFIKAHPLYIRVNPNYLSTKISISSQHKSQITNPNFFLISIQSTTMARTKCYIKALFFFFTRYKSIVVSALWDTNFCYLC